MSLTKGSELTITAAATPKQTTLRRRTLWFWVFIFDATTIALLLVDCLALTAYAKVYILLIYTDALKALGVCMPWYPKLTDLLDKCFVIYFTGCSEGFIPQGFYHWGYHQLYIYRVRHKSWYGISNGCGTKRGKARSTKIFVAFYHSLWQLFWKFENFSIKESSFMISNMTKN